MILTQLGIAGYIFAIMTFMAKRERSTSILLAKLFTLGCLFLSLPYAEAISCDSIFYDAPFKSFKAQTSTVKEASEVVKTLEIHEEKLLKTIGYGSKSEYEKDIDRSHPLLKKIFKLLADEQVEAAMRARENLRTLIVQNGFLNIHETRTGNGSANIDLRNRSEAIQAFIPPDKYESMDPKLKPKYGYLAPAPNLGLPDSMVPPQYGTDVFVFDLKKVRGRMTWTPGDSLHRFNADEVDYAPDSWDKKFLPWKSRNLIAPTIAHALLNGNRWFPTIYVEGIGGLPLFDRNTTIPELPHYKAFEHWEYVELQFWGPLTLADVKIFEFRKTPPSGDFLDALIRFGIEIRDGRSGTPQTWKP